MAKKKTAKPKAGRTKPRPAKKYPWIAEDLRPLAVSIGQLKPDPGNPRRHDQQNIAAIGASLRQFGQVKPIVVNRRSKIILAGNGTYQAAGQLGWSHLAVVWVAHDPTNHAAFAIADNRTAELAEWDDQKLEQLLTEFQLEKNLGDLYDQLLLDRLREQEEEEEQEPSAAEEKVPEKFQVVVDCKDEADQKRFYQRMEKEGRACRLLTL